MCSAFPIFFFCELTVAYLLFFDALFIHPSIFSLSFLLRLLFLKHLLRNIALLPAPLCLGKAQAFFSSFFFFKSEVFEFQWETEKGIRKQSKQFFVFSIALQVVHLNTTHIVLSCFNSWFAKREFSTVSVSVSVFSFFFSVLSSAGEVVRCATEEVYYE